ncbi:MAG: alpha-ketoglutarate-dependent dioxygenase AlkB [Proteobacteria bacterium]|nr:alpha-ketoglutarate-dependent dioxygenase AlkB [Pseudomonadota bacterium]
MPAHEPSLPDVRYLPGWLPHAAADALFAQLHAGIAWECHCIVLFGREVASPRLSCWIGDTDAAYTYSRTRFEPRAWPSELLAIRTRLRDEFDVDCNGVLANLYRDGNDAMGWHADDEPEIDPCAPILSLNLGATRRFVLRRRDDHALRCVIELAHGGLLLMPAGMQQHWQHALPKTSRTTGERINLTFRRIRVGIQARPT